MFIKIRTPDGNWDLREAQSIKYSYSPTPLIPDKVQVYSHACIPGDIEKVLGREDITFTNTEVYPFSKVVYPVLRENPNHSPYYEWKSDENIEDLPPVVFFDHVLREQSSKIMYTSEVDPTPKCWKGMVPLYNYAILDGEKAIIFPTEAYIINDSGKTIAKIGS